jgi:hypothetical protein
LIHADAALRQFFAEKVARMDRLNS